MAQVDFYDAYPRLTNLADTIRRGECVLFLGAGVSLDSGAPSGKQLADDLSQKFLHVDPGTYPLDETCDLIDFNDGRPVLNAYLSERFEGLRPKGALLSIPYINWQSIYTVNFDTLLEQAYTERSDRIQNAKPFYSDKDPLSRLRPGEVPLYKLHGCLSRANSEDGRLVLTQQDFLTVADSRQRLLNRLIESASDYTILFVGFGRRDLDFQKVLLDVHRVAGRLIDVPRSYALQPGYSDAELHRAEQKRVTLINATAADFFAALDQAVSSRPFALTPELTIPSPAVPLLRRKTKVTAEVLDNVARNVEILDERIREQVPNTQEFFLGSVPNWGAIASKVDAPRDVSDDVLLSVLVDPLLDRGADRFVLIHAEAGAGKTTLLRHIGVELALTWNAIVLALKPFGDLDFLDLERFARVADERIYLIVDDAATNARAIADVLRLARSAQVKITIIAAARTNEWREVEKDYSFPNIHEVELGPLSKCEIESVLSTLDRHGSLGLLVGASREAQIAAFEAKAEKQLLVAMREATEGKAFDEIVVDEFDRIPTAEAQQAYLLVAALHRFGILTRPGLLYHVLDLPLARLGNDVFGPAAKIIVPRYIQGEEEQYYTTRHQIIAEIVFDRKMMSERLRRDYYARLIEQLDLGYSSDADAYRKLTRGKNKQLLRDFRDVDSQRDIMGQLLQVDPTDAVAYQHAAMMELDHDNLVGASKYLDVAIKLRPDDLAIRDTEGRLALMSAKAETDDYIAQTKYERAESIFERNTQRRHDEPFGYRHLAETYVAWSARQSTTRQRLHYHKLAYDILLRGIRNCSSSAMLFQYLGQLEEEVGNDESARDAFAHALREKPGDLITRLMAARLEERTSAPNQALCLLEQGLEYSADDPELHYRLAMILAKITPDRDADIRRHFEAALLGPQRNYRPKMAFAAYLFAQGDFSRSRGYFEDLDRLPIFGQERYEPRTFAFGQLRSRHTGAIRKMEYRYGFVDYGQAAQQLYLPLRQIRRELVESFDVGRTISYEIRFNLLGPLAFDARLVS